MLTLGNNEIDALIHKALAKYMLRKFLMKLNLQSAKDSIAGIYEYDPRV